MKIAALPQLPNIAQLSKGMSLSSTKAGGPWESFSTLLSQQIKETQQLEKKARVLGEKAMLGNAGVSLHEAQIAGATAELHMQLLVQTRNKAVEVYKEVMNMPV
ncbi:flagellar hook-basal body complex subunit FliE [Magnetococcus marinus MC-1]|uniref:Flagellar hook-basal body complex protein FliE n=1 Tax=Magnetococcus marinus (strain ATCC BAA-1437 / JCM 17883 / MC-1) TaxID=156889 RepID=A0L4A2_MAGMM|nr:flagellar hook-basal body complex protein FliE [Magnetococcus marinus]ABK42795.1 flagellar hook-basal body complex subunit FliE [Magnetococcus marinus MC-1]